MAYLYVKTFHIVAVIAWMVGLFYLPRLFVYHASFPPSASEHAVFKIMEGRLLRIIMLPSMIGVWISGLLLAFWGGSYSMGWLHLKIALVFLLSAFHGYLVSSYKKFYHGKNKKTSLFFRIINEIPTLIMCVVVFLVVVKPF